MGLSVKYLWRTLLFNGMNARIPTRFLKILHQQKQCQLDWKGRAGWNVRKRLGFQNSIGKNQAYETTQVQLCTNLQEKGKMTPKIESQATGYYFQVLPYWILKWVGPSDWLPCLPFSPFCNGDAITVILCLPYHLILEADNLPSGFTDQQTERNFTPGWVIPRVSSIPDLDV